MARSGFGGPGDLTVAAGGVVNALEAEIGEDGLLNLGIGGTAGAFNAPTISHEGLIVANFIDTLTLAAAITGTGSLVKENIGELILTGNSGFSGGTSLNGGVLDIAALNAAGAGAIAFGAGSQVLQIQKVALAGNSFGNTIASFGSGDVIELPGLVFAGGAQATYDTTTNLLTVVSKGVTNTLDPDQSGSEPVQGGQRRRRRRQHHPRRCRRDDRRHARRRPRHQDRDGRRSAAAHQQ